MTPAQAKAKPAAVAAGVATIPAAAFALSRNPAVVVTDGASRAHAELGAVDGGIAPDLADTAFVVVAVNAGDLVLAGERIRNALG